MGCQNCSDCEGEKSKTAKSIEFYTEFKSGDCEIDDNGPYYQTLTIDSNRATDAKLRITANPDAELDIVNGGTIEESIQSYESGVDLEFEIEKSNNGTQPQALIKLEIEFRRRDNRPWKDLTTIEPRRKITLTP